MTPEQIVTFIKILNHHEILSFSDEDPMVLNLGVGVTIDIWADGTQRWWLNVKLHRTDGPAVTWADRSQFWWLNGQLHREDGPAEIYADGSQHWWLNGKRHREDGPAAIYAPMGADANGSQSWWLNGKEMTQKEHNQRTTSERK